MDIQSCVDSKRLPQSGIMSGDASLDKALFGISYNIGFAHNPEDRESKPIHATKCSVCHHNRRWVKSALWVSTIPVDILNLLGITRRAQ